MKKRLVTLIILIIVSLFILSCVPQTEVVEELPTSEQELPLPLEAEKNKV